MPIGGADMPVVISLLNSFTGVAAVFAAGFYTTIKSCLPAASWLVRGNTADHPYVQNHEPFPEKCTIGSFGGQSAGHRRSTEQGTSKISLSDAAMVMNYANKVMIVPGYGLAVAQAQHICHELEKLFAEKGFQVSCAIHPVAGRMPRHMNVLLAEADVSYDKLMRKWNRPMMNLRPPMWC